MEPVTMRTGARPAADPPAQASQPLIERGRELGAIDEAAARLADGHGGVMVFEAPAGLGKTALLEHLEAQATAAGCRVRRAEPSPLERHFAYGVVRTLLAAPLRERPAAARAALLDGLAARAGALLLDGRAVAGEPSMTLAHSLLWLCTALAADRPLVLLVDDAHWADRPSLEALCYLARRIDDVPLLIAVCARPDDPGAPTDLLALLGEARAATAWRLQPLTTIGGAKLLRRLAPDAPLKLAWRVHAATGGNPWLLRELGRHLAEHGIDSIDDHERGGPVSAVAQTMVRGRLAAAGAEARAVAAALAVLGDPTGEHVLAALAGVAPGALAHARDVLRSAGLLNASGGRLAPALIAAAIRDDLPEAEAERLHREAAELLAADGAGSDVVAAHLLQCGPRADPRVSSLLTHAAQAALDRGAAGSAAVYLERALLERAEGDDRGAMLAQLAAARFDAGLPGFRSRLRAALGEAGDAPSRAALLTRLAAVNVVDAADDEIAGRLEAEIARERDPGALAEIEVAALDALIVAPDRHRERAARAVAIAPEAVGDDVLAGAVRAHRAWLGTELGTPSADETAALATEALAHPGLLDDAGARAAFHLAARALTMTDRHDEAAAAIAALAAHARGRGSVRLRCAAEFYAAELELRRGRPGAAGDHARAALELAGDDGLNLFTGGAIAVLVCALAERGGCDEADELLRARGVAGALDDSYWAAGIRHARARLCLARGEYRRAQEEAVAAGALRDAQGRPNPTWTPWRSTAAVALAHLGRFGEAAALAGEELACAERFGAPGPIVTALHARAVAERDDAARVALCERALAIADRAPHPTLDAIRARIELGHALLRLGARVKARDALRPALAAADAVGAVALVQRARGELVASGLRPRRAALEGVAALTPRQREVGALAAAGRSNKAIAQALFLSIKTVETHLTIIYRTLGVRTRAELAGALQGD